jgi:stage III sporulation protein AB
MFENEILFMSNVLIRAFNNISKSLNCEAAKIFRSAADYLSNKVFSDAATAWEQAVRDNVKAASLNKEDEEILISFGKMLGNTDSEGQIKNIHLTIRQLLVQEKKAEELKKSNMEMYRKLGVLGGIAVVIVLF